MVKNGKSCKKCGKILSRKSKLRGHSLTKHGKLNLITIVPDRGKLDAHKLQVSNGKIASIQVMVANCDECSHTSELRNTFGTHIQSSHVWTVHSLKLLASSWFSTEQNEEISAKFAVNGTTTLSDSLNILS